jgi:hypothetical protein
MLKGMFCRNPEHRTLPRLPCNGCDEQAAEALKVSEGKTFALYNITISKGDKAVAFFSGLAYKL